MIARRSPRVAAVAGEGALRTARNFSDPEAKRALHSWPPAPCLLTLETALAKPPNYKQEKKRREEMQKKKNEAKRREQAARKENVPPAPKP